LFGTANTQFVHNLIGNTQIMKQVRQVTKAIAPREQAIWTLGDLYAYLCIWAYDVYDQQIHPALGMSPREAFQMGIARAGERAHLKALYDDDFRYLSLATTRKGTAQVKPGRGVKINYLYYSAKALNVGEVANCSVPVRYDPFDIGTAYAYVQGRWVQCRSEHYLQLRGHSERERDLASSELRKQHQNHRREATITAKRLADFLADVSAHETLALHRWHDLEARDVFERMGGSLLFSSLEPDLPEPAPPLVLVGSRERQLPSRLVATTRSHQDATSEIDEDDLDLSALDEYEEYR